MTGNDLDLVLSFEAARVTDLRDDLDELGAAGREEDARLEALEGELASHRTGGPSVAPPDVEVEEDTAPAVSEAEWADLAEAARQHFVARGVDPNTVDVDALLDPQEVAELRRVAMSTTTFSYRLDLTDLVIATLAGLVASAVDILIVKVPREMTLRKRPQAGSPMTAWMREHAVPTDNWLADLAKVPFDSLVQGELEPGISPRGHRADTFGHDPLFGLVFGVIDILRGTSTGVSFSGQAFVRDIADPATSNPLVAIVLELAHLLSDVGTKSGLPLPGWSILRLIDAGSIDGRTIGANARLMYTRGFDSWHLPTMVSSVAAADLVLRGGWAIRSAVDDDWAVRRDEEARLAGTTRTGCHPRFLLMSLLAHGIATAANAGKIAASGGNPVAWNAAQWARFAQLIAKWWRAQSPSISDAIAARSDINLEHILDGWPS